MTRRRDGVPASVRTRWYLAIAAVAGVALFVWTIVWVGPREIIAQLRELASVLPLILGLAAVRFWCQAAGWRLAMRASQRPPWSTTFAAVVAGEAAGYFAWGPVSREPLKALLVRHHVPERAGLGAAIVERAFYGAAAAALILIAIGLAALRYHFVGRVLIGLAITTGVALVANRYRKRFAGARRYRRCTVVGLAGVAAAQELTNLVEAYLVLAWLGAAPTLWSVVVLEGVSRLMNSAGQFIPGKLGVTEAVTAAVAESLRLGGTHGLSLALARRARSLAWGAIGVGLLVYRAADGLAISRPHAEHIRVCV